MFDYLSAPWAADRLYQTFYSVTDDAETPRTTVKILDAEGKKLAEVVRPGEVGLAVANVASVVAAAPELLEACKEGAIHDPESPEESFPDTLERIGRGTDWEDYCIEKAKQIRAAIAKAERED
jgi:hypothetical protein